MVIKSVFISFDYDNNLRGNLVAQSKDSESPFSITDLSVRGPIDENWRREVRKRIQKADLMIVICGERTPGRIEQLPTLNTAIVALYGFQSADFGESYWTLLVPSIGIFVSLIWFLIIKSHADLNSVKFALIHEMEQHLPAAMYKYEWQLAGGRQGKACRAVTTLERWIPVLFAVLHVILGIVIFLEISGGGGGIGEMNALTEAQLIALPVHTPVEAGYRYRL